LLAELSTAQLTALYPRELPGAPGGVPVQLNVLRRQLASIRRRGYATNFADISGPVIITGIGDATTNYVDNGGVTNGTSRYYRIRLVP